MMTDLVAAVVGAVVAVLARFGNSPSAEYVVITLLLPGVWLLACASTRAYEARFLGSGSEEFRRVFDAGIRLLAATALVSYAFKLEVARSYVLLDLPITVLLSLLLRYTARQALHRRRAAGQYLHKVVVIGRERSCAELVRQLRRYPYAGFSVVGACVDRVDGDDVEGVPVVGTSKTIVAALRSTGADTVAVGAWSDVTQEDLRRLSWELEGSGVAIVVAPSVTDVAGPRIHIRPVAGLPLLHVEEPEFRGPRRWLKAFFDRTVAGLAVVIGSPALIAIAIMVRTGDGGPALFRQQRVGADGRTFTMLKFRSMRTDAEAQLSALQSANDNAGGVLFKIREDPRVTTVGKVLRPYSLDELPQLFNVVAGHMSLVGPRPPLPSEVALYATDVHRRLLVKPGLTGLWQISGRADRRGTSRYVSTCTTWRTGRWRWTS